MRRLVCLCIAACAPPQAPAGPPAPNPSAPPTAPRPDAAGAVAPPGSAPEIPKEVQGKTPEGEIVAHLERFPGVAFSMARGKCYTVVYRLAPNAAPADVAIRVGMETADEKTIGRSRLTRDLRAFGSGPHCPHTPGTLRVELDDWYRMNVVSDGGRGDITLQLYSEPANLPELDHRFEAREAAIRHAESLPADCEDCDFNCRSAGTACEHRCFVDHQDSRAWGRDGCNETCAQITRACQAGCESRCR